MTDAETKPDRILRLPEVLNRLGMSRSWLYDRLNPKSRRFDPGMPRPIKIGLNSHAIGWLESSFEKWINSLSDIATQSGNGGERG